jgi:hypothetical protein
MIEDRYAAVSGVPNGTRGGFSNLYRSLGQAQVSARSSLVHVLRTKRRERQYRGGWNGELSLRHDAVPCVLRQPVTIPSLENQRNKRENTFQSCPTQGVGIAVQALAQKSSAEHRGETLVAHPGH